MTFFHHEHCVNSHSKPQLGHFRDFDYSGDIVLPRAHIEEIPYSTHVSSSRMFILLSKCRTYQIQDALLNTLKTSHLIPKSTEGDKYHYYSYTKGNLLSYSLVAGVR